MNTSVAVMDWNQVTVLDHQNTGYGDDAKKLAEQQENTEIEWELQKTVTFGIRHIQMRHAISEAAVDSEEDNWDGEGTKAYNPKSYKMAIDLIETLPTYIPVPDIVVDPDGMFEFEWYVEPGRVFSITMESNYTLIYSGLFGKKNKSYGTEDFEAKLPERIIGYLQRLYS